MRTNAVAIDVIDRESFLRYGDTVEVQRPDPGRAQRGEDEYRTLARVPSTGWRIAMHCVRARYADALHAYDSTRLLSPRAGVTLICVAPPERPDNVQIFVLDRTVTVNSGVPHVLITLSAESWVQVSENFDSRSQAYPLRRTLVPAGIWT